MADNGVRINSCQGLTAGDAGVERVVVTFVNQIRLTRVRVPPVIAAAPGNLHVQTGGEEEDGPGQDHVIVNSDEERYKEHGIANTFKKGTYAPDGNRALTRELTEREFEEEEGKTTAEEH